MRHAEPDQGQDPGHGWGKTLSGTQSEVTGYAVTVEVFVPARVAERMVDRLDAAWHVESWTPRAAAFMAAQEALNAAGLKNAVNVGTREVHQ